MPNHFHLMIHVREMDICIFKCDDPKKKRLRSINQSIGIMLRSYTRAVNKENKWSGSLFRSGTKAIPVNSLKSLMPTLANTQNIALLKSIITEKQYPQICFNYIHLNPVRARLVKTPLAWKYSSAREFYSVGKIKLTNIKLAKNLVDINSVFDLSEGLT